MRRVSDWRCDGGRHDDNAAFSGHHGQAPMPHPRSIMGVVRPARTLSGAPPVPVTFTRQRRDAGATPQTAGCV
jgi:hypothetical protein